MRLLTLSAASNIASRSRLCRAVKRVIFVPFRQAALRLGRRKRREAAFVISRGGVPDPRHSAFAAFWFPALIFSAPA